MGLFSFYLGYRKGRRRAERRAGRDAWWANDDVVDEDICDNCGYRASQHSDEGMCPDYGN